MREFDINSPARQASWLAQVGHESAHLACVEERLNYSADRLMVVWKSRFPDLASATPYARNPERLANKVYAGRMGNGNEASGDGWRHRGAGFIQLTGKENQTLCADFFDIPVAEVGDWLRQPEGACRSAGWFWATHGLNTLADKGDQVGITRRINGGIVGLADRLALFETAKKVLNEPSP